MGSTGSGGLSNFGGPLRLISVVSMAVLVVVLVITLVTEVSGEPENGLNVENDDRRELDINLDAARATAYKLRSKLVGLAKSLTGAGVLTQIYEQKNSPLSVTIRPSHQIANLITDVSLKMQNVLKEKEEAVRALKQAAEKSMKHYGAYKEHIDFEEVQYFNAKKVVIDSKLKEQYLPKIKGTIDYLPADKVWKFGGRNMNLTTNVSTVHVPTNIYDKSMKILNGVQWTENLTQQFTNNSDAHPNLRWQYFCSSDGFFRIFPGMQWPRDPEKVDVFDCRMQKWYIQAASTPKNIIILLDTSGSMTGKRFTIAQSTVFTILETLSDEDYFNIIKFSKEPEYVDPCFNGTMMPANVDNIRRMKEKILDIATRDTADFRKALTLAFRLFKEEQKTGGGEGSICNKAIMIITDGAPENYVDIYNKSNWPQKATRIFTYLIGKEVSDDRKVQWMACVNKGEFTHISTKADVQENVQQYIKVLSRPLVQNKSDHDVWSAIYLDYPTDQSPVNSGMPYMTNNLDAAFEDSSVFQGLGLVMSFAMPVFDPRTNTTVSRNEERPEKNLLGVVGTDVRINDIVKLIPTYHLGVNGYAFAVTNHGYILFHPDFRPFYKPEGQPNKSPELQLRPKYNSVDLSEVELPYDQGVSREHPLRKYLLTAREGGQNTTQTVLTHFDNLKRVKLQKNRYQFIAVADTFRLVFVLPDNYGDKVLTVDPFAVPDLAKAFNDVGAKASDSRSVIAPWIYCTDQQGRPVKMDEMVLHEFVQWKPTVKYECDKSLVRHLLLDAKETLTYDDVWNGSSFNPGEGDGPVKEECISRSSPENPEAPCIRGMYPKYGIDFVWIGTASGFTRYQYFSNPAHGVPSIIKPNLPPQYTSSIQSLYYQRAVYGWDEGLDYIFYMERDVVSDSMYVVMTTAEVVGRKGKNPAPVAVSALRMNHDSFEDIFLTETADCPGKHRCKVTCQNKDILNCYLIDNNGYVMASNNNETAFQKGAFFGMQDPTLMKELIRHQFFIELNVTDYQAMCKSQVSSQESSAAFFTTPFRLLFQVFFWFLAEIGLFLTEWSIRSWFFLWSVASQNPDSECGSTEYPQNVKYFLCNYVVFEHSNQAFNEHITVNNHACVQTASRYALNTTTVKAKKRFNGSLTDCGHCSASHTLDSASLPKNRSYTVIWLEKTNLILLMAAADCDCTTVNTTFDSSWEEVQFSEEEQCERLYRFSTELKRVDNTRTKDALCLDSRDEEDYTCGQSGLLSTSPHLPLTFCLLTCVLSHLLAR